MRKKLSNIEIFFLARFAHSAFYKIHISGAANRHAPVQYAKYFCTPANFVTIWSTVLNNKKNIYIQLMFWFVKTVH